MQHEFELHAIVHGMVQGVFFRANAKKIADSLNIVGTVQNLPNGTVEIFAQGSKKAIDEMMDQLCGPSGPGNVTFVEKTFSEPLKTYNGFSIQI